MKILVDFPENQVRALKAICDIEGIPRSEVIRQAVALHVDNKISPISDAFGLWKSSKPLDGLKHQKALREEW